MSHIRRRDLLKAAGCGVLFALSGCANKKPLATSEKLKDTDMEAMKLRPHHVLDIVTDYGAGERLEPHPYGHSLHIVAKTILSDTSTKMQFVVGADAVCQGCKHLLPDGRCDDVIRQVDSNGLPISKQSYNDGLDRRLLDYLGIKPGTVMTIRQYLETVNRKTPGIEKICTHPKEDEKKRLAHLTAGLVKLGIRNKA